MMFEFSGGSIAKMQLNKFIDETLTHKDNNNNDNEKQSVSYRVNVCDPYC